MPVSARCSPSQAPDTIAQQAAEWLTRLSSAATGNTVHADFEAWKQADPRHAAAATKLERFIGQLETLRNANGTQPALNTLRALERKPRGARQAVAALLVMVVLVLPVWGLLQSYPPAYLWADIHTMTGKWETQTLADGSRVTLNSASAVNLHFDARRRALELVQGEILVEVAHDSARPFVVETLHGSIRALGTRFVVSRGKQVTTLTMLESRAAAQAILSSDATVINAGQSVRITPQGLGAVENIDIRSVADSWRFQQLIVQDRPLAEVLDELARHRPGRLQYDPAQLAGLRVSAVLPLNDTDRALQLLADSFSIRVRHFTQWLVHVDASARRP